MSQDMVVSQNHDKSNLNTSVRLSLILHMDTIAEAMFKVFVCVRSLREDCPYVVGRED